jgi:LacI family transcriptional regulator
MSARRITISDVALRAGVAKATVSAVLNGRSASARISPATQEKVRLAAQELDYRPNGVARMLATQQSRCLGLVMQYSDVFSSSSGFMNEVMRGVCEACTELDYDLMLHTRRPREEAQDEAARLADGRVDGILALRDDTDEAMAAVARRGIPTVHFFCRPRQDDLPFVDVDNALGAELAVRHLAEFGHRRIAMITGSPRSTSAQERQRGFAAAMRDLGLAAPPEMMRTSGELFSDPQNIVEFSQSENGPTAWFVWSDDDARRLVDVMSAAGLLAPFDFSVVGFDSTPTAEMGEPPLTSVRQPIPAIAREAALIADSLILGLDDRPRQVVFPPRLDARASVRPPADLKTHSKTRPS